MRRLLSFLALALAPLAAFGQLSEAEQQGLDDALLIGNIRRADLGFERFSQAAPPSLPLILQALRRPIDTANQLMRLQASSRNQTGSAMAGRVMFEVFGDAPTGNEVVVEEPPPAQLPPRLGKVVARLAARTAASDREVRAALSKLTPAELRELIEGLPTWALEEPRIKLAFVRSTPPGKVRILELMQKVDLPRIRFAGLRLATAVEEAALSLQEIKEDVPGIVRLQINRMVVEIGGSGPNLHASSDARISIDLGGNDLYTGRVGAGVGYSSVLIDLAGDDRYQVGDLSVGSAVLGVGIARDQAGDDVLIGQSICFGSGIGGVGIFENIGGNDSYRSVSMAQGFGHAGIGILSDTDGDDDYRLNLFGQGAARWFGLGWLADRAGDDRYQAGGLILNSPLFTTAHYSFAQGFGMGYREDTGGLSGGIGMLADHAGDDSYQGETYMQAASYWLGIGSLYDAGGNDTYSGHHYCQASAMHLCASFLFDLGGDDAYAVKVGAAHSIGHDYGVAFLLDRAGDDLYASRDSTPGIGTANGVGIFLEAAGIDRYHGPPGKGNPSRGTGSIGVFADLAGADMYRFGLMDGEAAATESWGAALDVADPPAAASSGQPAAQTPTPGSATMPSEEEMQKLYAAASQWGVGSAVQSQQAALNQLIAIGARAVQWMLDKRLATSDRLQNRAFVAVIRAVGSSANRLVVAKMTTATDAEMANLLRIATDAGVADIGPSLPPLFEKPTLRNLAITAAGSLKLKDAIPALSKLAGESTGITRRAAVVSLMQIGDAAGATAAIPLLVSEDFLTRKAALRLAGQHPAASQAAARELMLDADEFRARIGIELTAAFGTPEALDAVGKMLLDPRPGVRVEAVIRLDGRCPDAYKEAMTGLRSDPIPSVRAAAKRARI